jgi:hypothetical protein
MTEQSMRRWVAYMKKKGKEPEYIGTLEAPNLREAHLLAIERFNVPAEGQNRLFVKAEDH